MKKRVLVVEDDPVLQRLLRRSLAEYGCEVEACASTDCALGFLKAGGVDVVLLDLMLGSENGWETLRLIRELGSVPVILMTGARVDEDVAKDARLLGAQGIATKPFEMERLAALLDGLTRR